MRRSWPAVLAVGAGWLTVMPSSILTVALRMQEIDAPPVVYSLILTAGWAALIGAVSVFGRLSDRRRSDLPWIRRSLLVSIIATIVLNLALAETFSDTLLLVLWMLLQIPAAAIVAIAMTFAAQESEPTTLRRISAYVGATPLIAILFGSIGAQLVPDTQWGFRVPGLVGALLMLPFLQTVHLGAIPASTAAGLPPQNRRRGWRWFLLASFMTSWTTSAATSYLVPYASVVLGTETHELATQTSRILMVATLLSITSSLLLAPRALSGRFTAAGFPIGAALMTCGLLLIVLRPDTLALGIGASLSGFGFGLVNGVELHLIASFADERFGVGQRIGQLTSATTIPYIAVPLTTSALLAAGAQIGLTATFWLAAIASAAALVMSGRFLAHDA